MLAFLWHARWVFEVRYDRVEASQPVGWMAHLSLFSLIGIGTWVWVFTGLPLGRLLPVMSLLDLFVTWQFLRRSLPRIRRLGWSGPLRARWWIEAAALDWTLVCSSGLFWLAHSLPKANLPPWQAACVWFALWIGLVSFVWFFVFAVTGYALGLIQRRAIHGRAAELVNFFFWPITIIGGISQLVPENPVWTDVIAPGFLALGVGIAGLAAVLEVRRRLSDQQDRMTTPEQSPPQH